MSTPTPNNSGANTSYDVTLVGPAHRDERRGLLRLTPWSGSEWRRVVLTLDVGSERCPSWDHAERYLAGVQDLIKLNDGFLTDEVVNALKNSMQVTSFETFRGPPRR